MEDSSLVIDGLIDAGCSSDLLIASIDKLVEKFYCIEDGAFHTLNQGRSNYWLGPSLEANAFGVYLLRRLVPHHHSKVQNSVLQYLLNQPFSPSGWQGKWFQQQALTHFYVLRAFFIVESKSIDLLPILILLLQNQHIDGSWNQGLIATAMNALNISYLIRLMPQNVNQILSPLCPSSSIDRAIHWLESEAALEVHHEPILYYWYEDKQVERANQKKLFYHCEDRGHIAESIRQYSLRELSCNH